MEEIEPIDADTELHKHHSKARKATKIVLMPAITQHVNPREYEVFVAGSLFRSTDAQLQPKRYDFNRTYRYALRGIGDVDPTLESNRTFICTLQLIPRGNRPIEDPESLPPDVGISSLWRQ